MADVLVGGWRLVQTRADRMQSVFGGLQSLIDEEKSEKLTRTSIWTTPVCNVSMISVTYPCISSVCSPTVSAKRDSTSVSIREVGAVLSARKICDDKRVQLLNVMDYNCGYLE